MYQDNMPDAGEMEPAPDPFRMLMEAEAQEVEAASAKAGDALPGQNEDDPEGNLKLIQAQLASSPRPPTPKVSTWH